MIDEWQVRTPATKKGLTKNFTKAIAMIKLQLLFITCCAINKC